MNIILIFLNVIIMALLVNILIQKSKIDKQNTQILTTILYYVSLILAIEDEGKNKDGNRLNKIEIELCMLKQGRYKRPP